MRAIKRKLKLIGIILAVIAVIAGLIWLGIFWWTMLGLLILIIVLLHFSVTLRLSASRSEGIDISAKWLFLTLYPRGKKKETHPSEKISSEDFDQLLAEDLGLPPDIDDDDDIVITELSETTGSSEKQEEEASDTDTGEETSPSEEKPAEGEDADKPDEKPEGKEKDKKEKKEKGPGKIAAFKAKIAMVKPYIPLGWKTVKKFCKAVRFQDVDLQADVGRFDAHEAAIYYGIAQRAMFSILSKIGMIFTLKVKQAEVRCHFCENKLDGSARLTVRVRPSTMIAIAFCAGVNFLIIFLRERRKKKEAAKANAAAA